MHCPNCGCEYVCPCEHCAKTFSKGKMPWISHDDDTEECPKCHLRQHLDSWETESWKQYKEEKKMGEQYVVVKEEPIGNRYNFSMFHTTLEEAKVEAVRLCEKHNGGKFLVMKVIGYAERKPNPVTYKEV